MEKKNKKVLLSIATILVFLAVWYLATNVGNISDNQSLVGFPEDF